MYNIIPLILILISLSAIIIIVIRKFSALANLDVDSIPGEKEAKFKEQIICNRLKRNITKWTSGIMKILRIAYERVSALFKWGYKKLHELKDNYRMEAGVAHDKKDDRIQELFSTVEKITSSSSSLAKKEGQATAEKKLIEIIGLDSQNLKAFKMLGDLYYEIKNYQEAKETFNHVLSLLPEDNSKDRAETYFELSLISKELEQIDESFDNLEKALEIDPNNPRYLDTMAEMSIINKDKVRALDAYKKLAEVNPDNQKLADFKEQIDEL